MKGRRYALQVLAAAAAAGAWPAARAQAYPGKPLRLVVGFTAGGAADVLACTIAKGLAAELNQQVVVDKTSQAPTASSRRRR